MLQEVGFAIARRIGGYGSVQLFCASVCLLGGVNQVRMVSGGTRLYRTQGQDNCESIRITETWVII